MAVLNGRPLIVTDIVTDDWYNYDAKYKVVVRSILFLQRFHRRYSIYVLPMQLKHIILWVAEALPARILDGMQRMGKGLYILELNTQPGMTKILGT